MRLAVSGLPRLVAICSMVFYYPLSLNHRPRLPIRIHLSRHTHPDILHITITYIIFIRPSPRKAN